LELNFPLFTEIDKTQSTELSEKERGLSELVRLCFGKPLNKSEQMSNWEKRPMRKSQKTYAGIASC
jgi:ribonuclease D